MANIKLKDINQLDTWNEKELRKLRINLKNRMSVNEFNDKAKDLPESHPLHGMGFSECKSLLEAVLKAERILAKK